MDIQWEITPYTRPIDPLITWRNQFVYLISLYSMSQFLPKSEKKEKKKKEEGQALDSGSCKMLSQPHKNRK